MIIIDSPGSDGIIERKVSFTSSEILAFNSTPKTLLSAPGAGKTYRIYDILGRLNFVTTAYATNVTLITYFNLNITTTSNSTLLSSVATRTGLFAKTAISGTTTDQYPSNSPLLISVSTSNPLNGDGTLDIYISYKIITL